MSDHVYTINIDINKKCDECGKGGATPVGVCMGCAAKAMRGKHMKSQSGRIAQRRFQAKMQQKP